MNDVLSRPAFVAYALSCVVLAANLFVLASLTGAGRGKVKVFVNPEDAGKEGKVQTSDEASIARLMRAHRNALENFVPFAVIGILYVLMGASTTWAYILFGTYTGARVLHSIMYLGGKQPWRTVMYGIGGVATLGMMIQVTRGAIGLM